MKFTPETYSIPDISMQPFIDDQEIWSYLEGAKPTIEQVEAVIARSMAKNRLSLAETAILLQATEPEMIEKIKAGARSLKEKIYGKRIVLFAPLYVGNYCSNNCRYCGFKSSNSKAVRKTLTKAELIENVKALEEHGQKRLILV
ncbi:MAG: [FeFe] hydrogenase H-cluster radical SAM maturase HydG, partial [Bacteroidales bacterium]